MRRLIFLLLFFLILSSEAFAAFTSDGTLITANNKTSGTTWSPNTSAALEVGHMGIITIAFDNLDTSDGNSTSVSSVTDAAGNTWVKAREFTNGEGSAGAGVGVSVWYTVATTQLNSASAINVTFSSAVTAKAMKGQEFSGITDTIVVDGTADLANDASDVGALSATGSYNVEHLWYRAIGGEEASTTWTQTSTWTKSNATASSGSTADTNVVAGAEFKILTATSSGTSDPTWYTADFASMMIGFAQNPPTPTPTATPEYSAFTGIGTFITAATKANGATYSPSTSTALEVGHLGIVVIAADNTATSDGNTSLVSSITDTSGNTWTKAREYTNSESSAGAGVTVSVWHSSITSHLPSGSQLTITFASAIDAKAVKGYEFLKPSGTISVDGALDLANDAADPGAMQASGSTVGDFIFLRAVAGEHTTTTWTATNDWTKVNANSTTGGADDSNVVAGFEFKIESGNIGPSSDPTWYSADFASVYLGITIAGQPTATPTPTNTPTLTPTVTPTPGPPFSGIGTFFTASEKPSGGATTSWVKNISTALNAGEVGIITLAFDNENDGSDGDTNINTALTDTVGNTWTKVAEYTNGQGAPRAGITNSVWYTKATTTIPALTALTFSFSTPVFARAGKGYKFQWPGGNPVLDGGPVKAAYDAQDPGLLSATGSTGKTHLWIRTNAAESPGKTWTSSTGWTRVNASATSLDNPDTNVSTGFEFRAAIGSSSGNSDPLWYTADHVSIIFGLIDDSPEATPTPTPTPGPTLTPTPTPTVDTSTRYECVKVTNLNNSGTGSFRDCAERNGPTLCVFETSGQIDLTSQVIVKANHFIAGQTAPSPGVMLTRGTIVLGYSDTWLEHLEIRIGDAEGSPSYNQRDAVQISAFSRPPVRKVRVRNVSMSWAIDENLSTNDDVEDVIVQDSIVGEGLRFSYHNEGTGDEEHSSGLIIGEKGRKQTFIRNLFIHNKDRNPLLKNNSHAEFINNFIFNYGPTQKSNTPRMEWIAGSLGPNFFDLIGNYMKAGVNSSPNLYGLYVDPNVALDSKYYIRNNRGDTRPNEAYPEEAWVKPGKEANRSMTKLLGITDESQIVDVDQLLDRLEASAGARYWERNPVDLRYFEQTRQGTGEIPDCVITERCQSGDIQVPEGGFPTKAVNTHTVPCATDYNILELREFLEQYEGPISPTPTPTPTVTPTITPGGPTLTPTPTPLPYGGAQRLPLLGAG